jgi:hypothetical protein
MCLYPNFRVFDFFKVEGYAFKCLKACKLLLSQTLNCEKGTLPLIVKKVMATKLTFDPTNVRSQLHFLIPLLLCARV